MIKRLIILFLIVFLLFNVYAECNSTQIDINSASAEELDVIVWVGPATASNIISYRETNIFDSLDELINVSGIGEKKLSDIKQQGLACVDEESEEQEQSEENEEESEETQTTSEENHSENESEEEETESDEKETEETPSEKEEISENITEKSTKINPIILNSLNSKTIKSEDNKENLTEDLALYGIIAFCSVFGALLLLKKRKYKNEFQ